MPRIVLTPPEDDPISPDGQSSRRRRAAAAGGVGKAPTRRPARPVARLRSPDNGYGGYGGQVVNQIAPGGSSYSGGYPNGQSASGQPISGQPINAQPARISASAASQCRPTRAGARQLSGLAVGHRIRCRLPIRMVSPGGAYPAQAPGGYSTQPPIVGAPPSGSIYPPNYTPPPAGYAQGGPLAPGNAAPGYGAEPEGLPSPSPEPLFAPDDRPRIPRGHLLERGPDRPIHVWCGRQLERGPGRLDHVGRAELRLAAIPDQLGRLPQRPAFRGAGQKFRIEAAPGTQVSRYMFNFAEPYLLDTPVSFGLSGYYFKRFYQDWTEQRTGGRTSLGYQFSPDLSGSLGFRGEDVLISNPQPADTDQSADAGRVGAHADVQLQGTMAWDTRDNTFLPTQGNYVALSVAYTEGTFQYPDLHGRLPQVLPDPRAARRVGPPRAELVQPVWHHGLGHADLRAVLCGRFLDAARLPIPWCLAAWSRPMSARCHPQRTTIQVGGNFQNLSSVEYMFPLTADDMLRGVVFCDFGTVEQSVKIVGTTSAWRRAWASACRCPRWDRPPSRSILPCRSPMPRPIRSNSCSSSSATAANARLADRSSARATRGPTRRTGPDNAARYTVRIVASIAPRIVAVRGVRIRRRHPVEQPPLATRRADRRCRPVAVIGPIRTAIVCPIGPVPSDRRDRHLVIRCRRVSTAWRNTVAGGLQQHRSGCVVDQTIIVAKGLLDTSSCVGPPRAVRM